jgi:hypothetical protein
MTTSSLKSKAKVIELSRAKLTSELHPDTPDANLRKRRRSQCPGDALGQ